MILEIVYPNQSKFDWNDQLNPKKLNDSNYSYDLKYYLFEHKHEYTMMYFVLFKHA